MSLFYFLAHYDRCEGRSSRQKKETQSLLKFTKTKKRSLPEETSTETGSSSKKSKPTGDSDIDNSDRETE